MTMPCNYAPIRKFRVASGSPQKLNHDSWSAEEGLVLQAVVARTPESGVQMFDLIIVHLVTGLKQSKPALPEIHQIQCELRPA